MKKFTFLKSLFLAVILAVGSNSAWAETIFSFTGTSGYAAPPAEGWTMEGTTAGGSYLKLDGGSVTSPVYQVYDNLVFSSDVATFGSGTAHPLVVEILKEGEVAQTFETKTPSKSDYIDGGNINIGNIDYPFQIRLSGETSRGVRVRNFTLTGDVPAVNFTITATSNDQGLGTVVVEGSTIKATLGQCATYAESAYTVTAGEANVTQEGDLFYVSATDDCTIQINFASIPNSTVILNAGSGSLEGESTFTQENCEAPITLPKAVVCETAAIAGWTFAGWSESEITETSQAPSLIPAGEYIPSSDITLYAVYQLGELDVFSVTLTKDNFGTNGYDANNGEHSIIATNEETVTIYTHQLMQQSSAIQWQKETAYLYNLTDFGGITKVVIDEYNDVNNLTVRESTAAGNDKGEIIEPTIEGKTYTYTMSGNNGFVYISAGDAATTKINRLTLHAQKGIATFATSPTCSAGPGTGIAQITMDGLYAVNGTIYFNAAAGERVEVINTLGQCVYAGTAVEGLNSVAVEAGIVVVKVGNQVGKVVVK